jgi:hypothetical protein
MGSYQPGYIPTLGMIAGDGNLVVLMPEEWIEKRFPLMKHIDVGSQLAKGTVSGDDYADRMRCRTYGSIDAAPRRKSSTGVQSPRLFINPAES